MKTEKIHILVVDDDQDIRNLLDHALKKRGLEVSLADDAYQALELLEQETPDLILLDVMMPGMDGYEFIAKIKSNVHWSAIPVIFITALRDKQSLLKGFKLGAVDFIVKPIQISEAVARINTHVELKRAKGQLQVFLTETKVELEETNSALTVLLKKSERDRAELEANLSKNIQTLLQPLLLQLKSTELNLEQAQIVEMAETSLEEVMSPFSQNLGQFQGLTSAEIDLVKYIKMGKSSKEIAGILGKSPRTIEVHRKSIRNKLGIANQKINLTSFLNRLGQR
ncbi:MAG: response regulator [SAR324 cluster bacterium]|nr:response regulator [SAR324 cluster bacterium]